MRPVKFENQETAEELYLKVYFDTISIFFLRDLVGRYFLRIVQDSTAEAKRVEVVLHKLFGGTFTEVFYEDEFQPVDDEAFMLEKRITEELFRSLEDSCNHYRVTARFVA